MRRPARSRRDRAAAATATPSISAVVDRDGNACSFINSLFEGFGSGILAERSGVMLHNRGFGFRLERGHPNCIAPFKRPMHTIIPGMVTRDGEAVMPYGVMGGHYQPMGQTSFLANYFDYGLDLQESLDLCRLFPSKGKVQVERGVPAALREGLAQLGHVIEQVDRAARRRPGDLDRPRAAAAWSAPRTRARTAARSATEQRRNPAMIFYNSQSPNPRVVRMFMAEKGIVIPAVQIDVPSGENRQRRHLARNPAGQTPCLELDDGFYLSEITAICEYLEEIRPAPPLIGTTRASAPRRACGRAGSTSTSSSRSATATAIPKGWRASATASTASPRPPTTSSRSPRRSWPGSMGCWPATRWVCGDRLTLADILLFVFVTSASRWASRPALHSPPSPPTTPA